MSIEGLRVCSEVVKKGNKWDLKFLDAWPVLPEIALRHPEGDLFIIIHVRLGPENELGSKGLNEATKRRKKGRK